MWQTTAKPEIIVPRRLPRKMKGLAVSSQALVFFGGAKGSRTPDLYNAIVALSQLSYGPEILRGALGRAASISYL